MRKTQFPRLVIPLAVVLTSLFNLGLNLVAVLVFLLAFGVGPSGPGCCSRSIVAAAHRDHDRGLDDRLLAVPALPRHGDHLDGAVDRAVLREPGAVPDREGARPRCATCSCSTRSRRCSSWRASGSSTRRARARRGGRRLPLHLLPALAIFVVRLRAGRLGVQARGAADRGGALRRARVVVVVAVAVLAWLGVMERDARLQARACRRSYATASSPAAAGRPAPRAAAQPGRRARRHPRAVYRARGARPRGGRAARGRRAARARQPGGVGVLRLLGDRHAAASAARSPRCAGSTRSTCRVADAASPPARSARRRARSREALRPAAASPSRSRRGGATRAAPRTRPPPAPDRARSARRAGEHDAGDHQREREQPDEAQLGGDLHLERVRVPHGLADRALAQPFHAEAAGTDAVSGWRANASSPTRQYS